MLCLGIYLFLEVRSSPATAEVPTKRAGETRTSEATRASSDEREAPAAPRRETRIPQRSTKSSGGGGGDTPAPAVPDPVEARLANLDKDGVMSEANKAYDRGNFDEALLIAEKVLKDDPKNVRMLRIMVSSACIMGDSVEAQKHYLLLPQRDRDQMRTRCGRYGVSFDEQ